MGGAELLGIQVIGLVIALILIALAGVARWRGRITNRFFFYWLTFWSLFLVLDLYPHALDPFLPILGLTVPAHALLIGSTIVLTVLVLGTYSLISDLQRKVITLAKEQATINYKLDRMVAEKRKK